MSGISYVQEEAVGRIFFFTCQLKSTTLFLPPTSVRSQQEGLIVVGFSFFPQLCVTVQLLVSNWLTVGLKLGFSQLKREVVTLEAGGESV